jgi:hypothetical protein
MALMTYPEGDRTEARRLQRLADAGQLRRIYPRIYTDDLVSPIEALTRRELYAICAILAPQAIISHRSALEGRRFTPSGSVYLTGPYRRDLQLPGMTLRIAKGAEAQPNDIRIPTKFGDAHVSSQARALLENLAASSGDPEERRSMGQEAIESWLDRFIQRDIDNQVNRLRDEARQVAEAIGMPKEFKRLDRIMGTLLGTQSTRLSSKAAIARAAGRPYDVDRLKLFDAVAEHLAANPLIVPMSAPNADVQLQAFVESYFSNYIEGTEFEIEVAHEIVLKGKPLQYREDDSHDILGTYKAILESVQRTRLATNAQEFIERLRHFNRMVIESRADKAPGEIKTLANRAGNTHFVAPDLVIGTLEKGFEYIAAAAAPASQAAMVMFVIAEVHPFTDGNGRTARVVMNEYLSAAGLTRIIVPTVFRDDYISALKAISSNAHAAPYERMLARAARFSRWIDFTERNACFASLEKSNAMKEPQVAKLAFAYEEPLEDTQPDAPSM